jgi:hypothetical protein
MALLGARTCLGTALRQGIIIDNRALFPAPHTLFRRNASTSKLKLSPKTTGKGPSSPKPTRKTSPVQKTKNTPTEASATQVSTRNAATPQEMSEEQQEKEIQRMLQLSERMPTLDIFGQQINSTLGVCVYSSYFFELCLSWFFCSSKERCHDSLPKRRQITVLLQKNIAESQKQL